MSFAVAKDVTAHPDALADAVNWVSSYSPAWADTESLSQGMMEALSNAIIHGVLGIKSEGREDCLKSYVERVRAAAQRSPNAVVRVEVIGDEDSFRVRLSWTGTACPVDDRGPRALVDGVMSVSGMGTCIIFASFQRVVWDENGLGLELWLQKEKK